MFSIKMAREEPLSGGRDPPEEEDSQEGLEARLSRRPTVNTNLMEFLVIAGLAPSWDALYARPEHERLAAHIADRYRGRRRRLTLKAKGLETKVRRRLEELYVKGNVRTVGDVVGGLRGGEVSGSLLFEPAVALNDILRYYGFSPIDEQALTEYFRTRRREPPAYRYQPPG